MISWVDCKSKVSGSSQAMGNMEGSLPVILGSFDRRRLLDVVVEGTT